MPTIRTKIRDGRIDIPAPDGMPDGTDVSVEIRPAHEKIGLDESEWRDDPEAIAEFEAWVKSLEPVEFREPDAFDELFRQYNIEAVRKQFSEYDE